MPAETTRADRILRGHSSDAGRIALSPPGGALTMSAKVARTHHQQDAPHGNAHDTGAER